MEIEKKSVAVLFTNWTKEDFTHKWDNVEYTFKAGSSTYIQDYLARHFSGHLAQRECNKRNLPFTDLKFQQFVDKCYAGEAIEAETPLKLEVDVERANETEEVEEKEVKKFCEFCDSKGVRHKKNCPTLKKQKDEDSFEGLK